MQRLDNDTIQWKLTLGPGCLRVILRRAAGTPYFVSKCGSHSLYDGCPYMVSTYNRTKSIKYFSCGSEHYLHRLVAKAWVYNPSPSVFKWVDHIDGDTQNNDASNLRWVSASLNALNRRRDSYAQKETRKYKSGKVGVFYQSTVTSDGVTKKITKGSKHECEKAIKHLINDKFLDKYKESLAIDPPERLDHQSYWRDDINTPTMRPGFFDTKNVRPSVSRTPVYII